VQYSFLFPTVKDYKNPPRETRVIVENNVASFFWTRWRAHKSSNIAESVYFSIKFLELRN